MTQDQLTTAYRALVPALHNEALEIEALLALWGGVAVGHPEAQNDESRIMRAAANALDHLLTTRGDLLAKSSLPLLQKSSA